VFGVLEHVLWPVRAADQMRARLADVLRSLAGLARACSGSGGLRSSDVDERRRLISQQVEDVQGFIESSKFEPGATTAEVIQQVAGDAQTIFLLLLAIARGGGERSEADRELRFRVATDVAAALDRVAVRLSRGETSAIDRDDALGEIERAIAARRVHDWDQDAMGRGALVLYRELAVAVKWLVSSDLRQLDHTGPRPSAEIG
jgi:hypothetical protein